MNNGTKIIFGLAILSVIGGSQSALAQAGAAWSKLPSGAKEAGLAGGMASLAQGLQGSRLAPSSLAQLQGMEAQASHDQWLQGVSQDQMAVGFKLGQGLGLAVAAEWLDMGEVTRYKNMTGGGVVADGTWHPNAGTVALSLGSSLNDKMDAGVAVRGWHQSLDAENSMAASFSASMGYRVTRELSLAASYLDLGTDLGGDALPTNLRLGAAWSFSTRARVAVESTLSSGGSVAPEYSAACEAPLGSAIILRGGVAQVVGQDAPALTTGLSVSLGALALDLAYRPTTSLGSAVNAGLTWTMR